MRFWFDKKITFQNQGDLKLRQVIHAVAVFVNFILPLFALYHQIGTPL